MTGVQTCALPISYTLIRLVPTGKRKAFPKGIRRVQVTAEWGYTNAQELGSGNVTLANASTTAMTTSVADSVAVGQTILAGAEQIYVSGGSGTSYTVTRGVNGTTAAAHAGVAFTRYVYVPMVQDATLILAGRSWKRRQSAYSQVIANPATGTYEIYKGSDPDVEADLWPYRRLLAP